MFVETANLTKRYREVTALDGCTFAAARGEVFGLLGPNGAGKTTLLRILLGFLRPTAGSATIDTLDCQRDSVLVRSRVSYLPGEARLFRRMRGHEILRLFASLRPGVELARSEAIADRLGLDASRPVAMMSTGMRQKLALAITLSPRVPLVILDEPTSSLDPTMRSEVLRIVGEIRAEGRTVLFSSHVLSEVEEICDRVAILRAGKIVFTQTMAELRRRHRITAQLAGPLPDLPAELAASAKVLPHANGEVRIDTDGKLGPYLGWLAQAPLDDVRIESIGLQAIYDHYHQQRS